jgi:hypothetical protein
MKYRVQIDTKKNRANGIGGSSLLFLVRCAGSGFWDELMARFQKTDRIFCQRLACLE